MNTQKYEISNRTSGQSLGQYNGQDETAALDAMASDAGYLNYDKMCEEIGGDGELDVIEIF